MRITFSQSYKAMALSISSTIKLISGTAISMLGFGTYSLKGQVCEDAAKTAFSVGYRHIDTGSMFKNQVDIIKAYKSLNLTRKDIFISTKVGPAEQGYKQSIQTCENIMKNLQSDFLDLVLIHWPGSNKCAMTSEKNKQYRLQTWKGLIQLKGQGKIKNIGVSNFMVNHLQHLENASGVRPAINQFEVHPLLWQSQLINYCRQKDIAIEAYSPIGKGDLRVLQNQTLISIGKNHNKTVAQVCLRWALQHNFIILPRSKNPEHIKQNANIFDFQLTQEELIKINQLSKNNVRINWDGNKVLH